VTGVRPIGSSMVSETILRCDILQSLMIISATQYNDSVSHLRGHNLNSRDEPVSTTCCSTLTSSEIGPVAVQHQQNHTSSQPSRVSSHPRKNLPRETESQNQAHVIHQSIWKPVWHLEFKMTLGYTNALKHGRFLSTAW
jgi:hypothetical protein